MRFEAEWDNTIYFENGIKHKLTLEEVTVIKTALGSVTVNEQHQEALKELKTLFLDYLD